MSSSVALLWAYVGSTAYYYLHYWVLRMGPTPSRVWRPVPAPCPSRPWLVYPSGLGRAPDVR